jgi:hypothetical protein
MDLLLCHWTSSKAAAAIYGGGFVPGTGAHDFLGPGVYGNVFSAQDLVKWRAGDAEKCVAMRSANDFAQSKYGPDVKPIIFSVSTRFVLDLCDSSIRPHFIGFINALISRARLHNIHLPEDEDHFRTRAHIASEAFRLVVSWKAGVPVDALLGRFSDLSAPKVAGGDPLHTVMAIGPAEICVKKLSAIRLISNGDRTESTSGDVEAFDYAEAAKWSINWLEKTTQARFVSLLMCAIHPRGVGDRRARPPPAGGVELLYSSRFSRAKDGYLQIIEDRASRAAEQCMRPLYVQPALSDIVSPEENRKWRRKLIREHSGLIIVLDAANTTLSGMVRSAVEAGLPCLAITSEERFIDTILWGKSNMLVVVLPMRLRATAEVRSEIGELILGFMSSDWSASSASRNEAESEEDIALALEGIKIPARIRREDATPAQSLSVKGADVPAVAGAIHRYKQTFQNDSRGDQLPLFDEQ